MVLCSGVSLVGALGTIRGAGDRTPVNHVQALPAVLYLWPIEWNDLTVSSYWLSLVLSDLFMLFWLKNVRRFGKEAVNDSLRTKRKWRKDINCNPRKFQRLPIILPWYLF